MVCGRRSATSGPCPLPFSFRRSIGPCFLLLLQAAVPNWPGPFVGRRLVRGLGSRIMPLNRKDRPPASGGHTPFLLSSRRTPPVRIIRPVRMAAALPAWSAAQTAGPLGRRSAPLRRSHERAPHNRRARDRAVPQPATHSGHVVITICTLIPAKKSVQRNLRLRHRFAQPPKKTEKCDWFYSFALAITISRLVSRSSLLAMDRASPLLDDDLQRVADGWASQAHRYPVMPQLASPKKVPLVPH